MNINLLFGNKTKVDILKYLMFKQEGVSARELESNLKQSFPAIKKQIDNLEEAWIILKNKTGNRWQLVYAPKAKKMIFNIFVFDFLNFLDSLLNEYYFLDSYWCWDLFFLDNSDKINVDLVLVYNPVEEAFLNDVKKKIALFFDEYFIDIKAAFFLKENFEKRLKYADKFVITLTKLNSLLSKN